MKEVPGRDALVLFGLKAHRLACRNQLDLSSCLFAIIDILGIVAQCPFASFCQVEGNAATTYVSRRLLDPNVTVGSVLSFSQSMDGARLDLGRTLLATTIISHGTIQWHSTQWWCSKS